jgi:prevent-host-death family protein
MKTITAVELRNNMGEILTRVQSGERLTVTYRGGNPVVLEPEGTDRQRQSNGKDLAEALSHVASQAKIPERYKTGNLKELYYQDMPKKHGLS